MAARSNGSRLASPISFWHDTRRDRAGTRHTTAHSSVATSVAARTIPSNFSSAQSSGAPAGPQPVALPVLGGHATRRRCPRHVRPKCGTRSRYARAAVTGVRSAQTSISCGRGGRVVRSGVDPGFRDPCRNVRSLLKGRAVHHVAVLLQRLRVVAPSCPSPNRQPDRDLECHLVAGSTALIGGISKVPDAVIWAAGGAAARSDGSGCVRQPDRRRG